MSHQSDLIAEDIEAYLEQHRTKELLRLITCGSVDDGKSTLIGRLLHDSKLVYEDQLQAVTKDSVKHGTTEEGPDLALLVDGLKAEREQGITIDVAYRYFSTARRKFIIADCPGHEQYTRNMATGASTCDLAIILIDARKGVLSQTKRHSFIVSLLGIKHVVVAINKMDLVGYDEAVFTRIADAYRAFASRLTLPDVRFIPLSALKGDNVVDASAHMPWYQGGTLMHLLEHVHIASDRNLIDLRLPIQLVLRPNLDFRGYAGTLASGVLRQGDEVVVLPSQKRSRVKEIHSYDQRLEAAFAPMSVVVTLEDEIDVSRGEMLCHPGNQPRVGHQFDAMLVWLSETPLGVGKEYLLKQTTRFGGARVSTLRYGIDVNTLHRQAQPTLELNQIGRCEVTAILPLFYDPYERNRQTGAFILIDRVSNATVAAGMILDRSSGPKAAWDDTPQGTLQAAQSPVSAVERAARLGQSPVTVLFTGLAGAGKSSVAHAVERRLFDRGRLAAVLDGQNFRLGLSRDLGFSVTDRAENLRRFAEVARLFNQAGLIVLGAFLAPSEEARARVSEEIGTERFLTVHLDCPVEVCRTRLPGDLYARAAAGELPDFPGVSSSYEPPREADLVLKTAEIDVDAAAAQVVALLADRGFLR